MIVTKLTNRAVTAIFVININQKISSGDMGWIWVAR